MKTGLVIIDIQRDYFPGGRMELVGADEAAKRAGTLLGLFRKSGLPVFHIQHVAIRPNATFLLRDTEGIEINPQVAPLPSEPVTLKHYPNSFRETGLEAKLRDAGVGRLVICGMMSHMCVDTSVRAAYDLGFECTVVYDACATRDLTFNGITVVAHQVHAAYMAALGAVFARMVSLEEIIKEFGGLSWFA